MKNILYILVLLFLSCKDSVKKETVVETEKPLLSVVKKHSEIATIIDSYKKEIENWEELNSLNSFLLKFQNTSPNEALSNALELKGLVKSLKDSLKPKEFDTPSFNTRVNILNNETLRLADLTFIPAITPEEVNKQVDKVLLSFSALKEKINTFFTQKKYESEIEINIDFIGIDSTKIDSISKKTITDNIDKTKPKKII